jgi:hypothetical protein
LASRSKKTPELVYPVVEIVESFDQVAHTIPGGSGTSEPLGRRRRRSGSGILKYTSVLRF